MKGNLVRGNAVGVPASTDGTSSHIDTPKRLTTDIIGRIKDSWRLEHEVYVD